MTTDQPQKDVRLAMTLKQIDTDRLGDAAREVGMPKATLARALVLYGLDRLSTDPAVRQAVAQAAAEEAERRRLAGLKGGINRQAQQRQEQEGTT